MGAGHRRTTRTGREREADSLWVRVHLWTPRAWTQVCGSSSSTGRARLGPGWLPRVLLPSLGSFSKGYFYNWGIYVSICNGLGWSLGIVALLARASSEPPQVWVLCVNKEQSPRRCP